MRYKYIEKVNLLSLVHLLHIIETVNGVDAQAKVAAGEHIPSLLGVFDAIRPHIESAGLRTVKTLVGQADDLGEELLARRSLLDKDAVFHVRILLQDIVQAKSV